MLKSSLPSRIWCTTAFLDWNTKHISPLSNPTTSISIHCVMPLPSTTTMEESLDHYLVLDVSPTASSSDLYFAYCVAVRQWLQSDSSFNHGILIRLQESYRVLQDPIRRAAFHTESYGNIFLMENRRKKRIIMWLRFLRRRKRFLSGRICNFLKSKVDGHFWDVSNEI